MFEGDKAEGTEVYGVPGVWYVVRPSLDERGDAGDGQEGVH